MSDDGAGRVIAQWAPGADDTVEARERFAGAVDEWLAATGEEAGRAASHAKGRRAVESVNAVTSVGRAVAPWRAEDFELETALALLDVGHLPDCPRPRPAVRSLGRRVDGHKAGVLECGYCRASLPLVDRRLALVDGRQPTRAGPPRGMGLTLEKLVQAVAECALQDGPPTQEAVATYLGKSDRRVRHVAQEAGGWEVVLRRAGNV